MCSVCTAAAAKSLQYSCLENPRDGGAWWAAVCGVAQSWTRLKRLSSSSSSSSRGLWGFLICSQTGQKLWGTWGPLACNWHLKWVGAVSGMLSPYLWDLTLSLGR